MAHWVAGFQGTVMTSMGTGKRGGVRWRTIQSASNAASAVVPVDAKVWPIVYDITGSASECVDCRIVVEVEPTTVVFVMVVVWPVVVLVTVVVPTFGACSEVVLGFDGDF